VFLVKSTDRNHI